MMSVTQKFTLNGSGIVLWRLWLTVYTLFGHDSSTDLAEFVEYLIHHTNSKYELAINMYSYRDFVSYDHNYHIVMEPK
jgi:hypothetical protein